MNITQMNNLLQLLVETIYLTNVVQQFLFWTRREVHEQIKDEIFKIIRAFNWKNGRDTIHTLQRLESCPGCLWTDTVPVVADQVGEFMILHVKGHSSSLVSRRLDLSPRWKANLFSLENWVR